MQLCRYFVIAAALLLCSIAAASAAGTGPFLVASDDFVLTGAQEQLLWQRIGRNASSTTPSGLIAAVGATLPASVALHALPATVTRQIPAVRPYKYAMLGKMLLIINPTHRAIVDVITQKGHHCAARIRRRDLVCRTRESGDPYRRNGGYRFPLSRERQHMSW